MAAARSKFELLAHNTLDDDKSRSNASLDALLRKTQRVGYFAFSHRTHAPLALSRSAAGSSSTARVVSSRRGMQKSVPHPGRAA